MERGNGKAQVVILAPQELIDRADALRIVMQGLIPGLDKGGMNRARVLEMALNGRGLGMLEGEYIERLERLDRVADYVGKSREEYARAYADLHQRKSRTPTLEDLEAGVKAAQG